MKLDKKPKTWEDRLTLFVGYLIETKKKSSTVKSYISAIKSVLIEDGREVHEDKFLFSSLTRACKLKNDRLFTKLPNKKSLHTAMVQELNTLFDMQPYLLILYTAMFTFGLLRISEIAETPSGHAVKANDVHIAKNKNKLMYILHTSKTHGKGSKLQIVKISSEVSTKCFETICSFAAVKNT